MLIGSASDEPIFGAVVGATGPRIQSYFKNALLNAPKKKDGQYVVPRTF